jgi:hypothetical protein
VSRYVALRDAGRDPCARVRRARAIDGFVVKVEEGSSLYQVGLVIKWGWSRRGGLTKG